jgi:hypothetical protein
MQAGSFEFAGIDFYTGHGVSVEGLPWFSSGQRPVKMLDLPGGVSIVERADPVHLTITLRCRMVYERSTDPDVTLDDDLASFRARMEQLSSALDTNGVLADLYYYDADKGFSAVWDGLPLRYEVGPYGSLSSTFEVTFFALPTMVTR